MTADVVLDADEAKRFLDELDNPDRYVERLRWLADTPSVLPE